ncbi:hypothetical protein RJ640_028459, partial [Escallonia rubra]
ILWCSLIFVNGKKLQKVVLKLEFHHEKSKQKAMQKVSNLSAVESIAMDPKDKKLTVSGHRSLSVGPAQDPEKEEEKPKKEEAKKPEEKKKYLRRSQLLLFLYMFVCTVLFNELQDLVVVVAGLAELQGGCRPRCGLVVLYCGGGLNGVYGRAWVVLIG